MPYGLIATAGRSSVRAILLVLPIISTPIAGADSMPDLRVFHEAGHPCDGRYLVTGDGEPFFYLGDTAWELFHRLTREETDLYLSTRAEQGFTVIQAVVLAELGGLNVPNAYGDLPLVDEDPMQPSEAYFEHVDFVVRRASEFGLYVGMLPTWGDKFNRKWGLGPEVFTPENARVYGEFLGRRYRDSAIIWILGGDRPCETDEHLAITRAMAEGIEAGDGGRHLMTYHPMGGQSCSQWFHEDSWLDFNMLQSGHSARDERNDLRVGADYGRVPVKPVIDGEPRYEDHPVAWRPEEGWFDAHDVRQAAYWALFAGAFGHTYGCHDIWQFWQPGRDPISSARTPWQDGLWLEAAGQVKHVRTLLESRPFLTRIPDQSLIASENLDGHEHIQATRDAAGAYALVYLPIGQSVTVDTDALSGDRLDVSWYDPRTGEALDAGSVGRAGRHQFTPPSSGPKTDWVLVLDDAAAGFGPPGE